MKKISSLLLLSLMLTACHKKNTPPVPITVNQAIAVLNAATPAIGLMDDKSDFKKPVYNTVPDHENSLADTVLERMASGSTLTYALSTASSLTNSTIEDNNGT